MKVIMKNTKNDEDIVQSTFSRLNLDFYEKFNVKYFTQKVSFLTALLSDTHVLSEIYTRGIKIGELKATGKELTNQEELHLKELLKAEISLVYYHAIETFFRVLIAHTYKTDCPWVEISDLNNYSEFKKEIKKIVDNKFPSKDLKQDEIITSVMFGQPKPDTVKQETWNQSIENTLDWINFIARDLLKNEDYNAYKHGLGLYSSELGFELAGTPLKEDKKEVLVYITQKKENGQINYYKTYKYINWQQKVALIFKVTQMMENIIKIGKAKYLGDSKNVRLHLFHEVKLADIFKSEIHANELKMSLPFCRKLKNK